MRFTKMQGIGNDYIYVDCTHESVKNPNILARQISDRHFGVGSDGLVLILPGNQGDFCMRMFNADGSEAEMCGNASRCVGKYLYERGLTKKDTIRLETGDGIKTLCLNLKEGKVVSVTVDMGAPKLLPGEIPTLLEKTENVQLEVNRSLFNVTCVNMGNPHCIVFLENVDDFDVPYWGPYFEHHTVFPERINTEFVSVIDKNHLRMRVWERGAGETMACGTGACAALVAASIIGKSENKAQLILNGGTLDIEWDKKTGHVMMSGPAEFVFEGEWPDP